MCVCLVLLSLLGEREEVFKESASKGPVSDPLKWCIGPLEAGPFGLMDQPPTEDSQCHIWSSASTAPVQRITKLSKVNKAHVVTKA